MFDFDAIVQRENTASLKWDRYKGQEILPFWVADMDFKVAEPIQKALEARVAHGVFGYAEPTEGLSEAVANHLKQHYDWRIDTSWIVWLPGVVTGLAACCRAFCPDQHEIVVNPPIYHHFFDAHEADRHVVKQVPLQREASGRWTYDVCDIERAMTEKTALMMLCSPHNPTGTVFTADELRAVLKVCDAQNVLVVSDEIHCDLVIDRKAQHIPTAKAYPEMAHRVITLMSASKTWNLAGLNCSFAIIEDEALRHRFKRVTQAIVPMVPPLAYEATLAAYRYGEPWRQALLDYLAGNYRCIQDGLKGHASLRVEPIQATYLAWIDASGLGVEDTQSFFESAGVGLSSGEQFGQPHYVRMNFACPRGTLLEGINRMKQALNHV